MNHLNIIKRITGPLPQPLKTLHQENVNTIGFFGVLFNSVDFIDCLMGVYHWRNKSDNYKIQIKLKDDINHKECQSDYCNHYEWSLWLFFVQKFYSYKHLGLKSEKNQLSNI